MTDEEIKKSFAFMKGEEKPKKVLSFIRTDGTVVINGIKIPSSIPLPVFVEEGGDNYDKKPVSASVSAVVDAMLNYLRQAKQIDKTYEFYKKVLLADTTLVSRLHNASLAKSKIETSEDASLLIEILHSLLCLENKEERYINLVKGLINAINAEQNDNALEYVISDYEDLLEKTLLSGLELYPTSYSLLFHTSDFYRKAENYETAKKHLELLKTHHKSSEIDKLEKAIIDAEKHENDILYIYDLINLERPDDAVKKADELLKDDPKNWYALMLKAWALRILEKWDDAKKAALLSIEDGGEDFAENYNELALCEFALKNNELAIYYAKIALDLEEESIEYATNLAMMLIEAGKQDEAFNALYTACLITEDDAILQSLISLYKERFKDNFIPPSERKNDTQDEGDSECCCHHEYLIDDCDCDDEHHLHHDTCSCHHHDDHKASHNSEHSANSKHCHHNEGNKEYCYHNHNEECCTHEHIQGHEHYHHHNYKCLHSKND